jgi:hypothetical protein
MDMGDTYEREGRFIDDIVKKQNYGHNLVVDENGNKLIRSFTADKDKFMGSVTLTPEMYKAILEAPNQTEAKRRLMQMAKIPQDVDMDKLFIHMNLSKPRNLSTYFKAKTVNPNSVRNWHDTPTGTIYINRVKQDGMGHYNVTKHRIGGMVQNPYLKAQYGTEVIVDKKKINTGSKEYRDMYASGNLMHVDKDGIPIRWSGEEAVVTAQMTDKERQKRNDLYNAAFPKYSSEDGLDEKGNYIYYNDPNGKGGIDAALKDALFEGLPELTGIPSLIRVGKDPVGHIQSGLRIMDDMSTFGTMPSETYSKPGDLSKTLDAVGAAGTVMPLAKGLSFAPKILGKVPKINTNIGLKFTDKTINAQKAIQQGQVILPESSMATAAKTVDDVTAKIPNAKEIEQITTYKNDLLNRLKTTEEGKRRLANLGLTPEDLNDIDLGFTGGGSKALYGKIDITGNPYVNVDFKQIAENADLGLTTMNVASHEIGHALQYLAAKKRYSSGVNPTDFKYSWKDLNKTPADQEMLDWLTKNADRSDEPYPGWFDQFPGIDKSLLKETPKQGASYLTTRSEPYAHLREFRTNMMDEGILKNEWDNVTEDMVDKFMNTSSNDRMKGFMKNTPDFRKRMSVLLNKYPAVIPGVIGTGATAAGISQLNQKRQGGQINPYLK